MSQADDLENFPDHVPLAQMRGRALGDTAAELPAFLRTILADADALFERYWLVLFGSRARGDERPHSDWDLCFIFPEDPGLPWTRFQLELPERAETLLGVDAVAWHEVSPSLRAVIRKEGVVLHAKTP